MSDPRYVHVALEIFDLHHALNHSIEFEACPHPYCRESSELVRQHAMAELFLSRQNRDVPTTTLVEAECEETDYDKFGDHDGTVRRYRLTGFVLGKRPDETILLCQSHRNFRFGQTTVVPKDEDKK